MIFNKPPDKIYLQYHGDSEPEDGPVDADDVTWCWHGIFKSDLEYVLASESTAQPAGQSHCKSQCESASFKHEIKRLRSAMFSAAAYLAIELFDENIPEANAERLRVNVVLKLKSAALSGPR